MSESQDAKWMVGKVGEGPIPNSEETATLYVKGWMGDGEIMVTTSATNKAWPMDADDLRNVRSPKL